MTLEADRAVRQPLLPTERQVTVSHIYKLSTGQLQSLFQPDNLQRQLDELKNHGSTKGVLKKLASEATTGIVGDEKDLRRRKAQFGVNTMPIAEAPRLLDSLKQTCQDRLWWVAGGSAVVSAVVGGCVYGVGGLVEGASIVAAVILIIAISSLADWYKDRRFVQLQSLIQEESIAVMRGKLGATQSVSVWDLVVGDVILLETGARLPADCLVIESADLEAEEIHTSEDGEESTRKVSKCAAEAEGVAVDPFLLADSLVTRGQCKAVVCCVGGQSSRGTKQRKLDTDTDTRLQAKLKNLTGRFTVAALWAALLIFVALSVVLIIEVSGKGSSAPDAPGVAGTLFSKLLSQINLCVVLIVVAVPEGLPLTIGVSLAFSVMAMYEHKILVRKLDAPERTGAVEEFCCGKTGTITRNDMKVAQFHCEGRLVKNTRKNTLLNCELSAETLERIKDGILYNCEARIEMDATAYVPVGNGTEVALLRFLQEAEIPVHLLIQRKLGRIRAVSPFSPERKRSVVALECPDRPDRVAVYVKGAPEVVLALSTHTQEADGTAPLEKDENGNHAALTAIVSRMAQQPLRVLAFAYMEMDLELWTQQYETQGVSPESALEDALSSGELGLTFLGVFGLKDPLRAKVRSSLQYAEQGDLRVRLVSGDHLETAKAVALKAGILRPEEAGRRHAVMSAEAFRRTVGELQRSHDSTTGEITTKIENEEAFAAVVENLRVLARATAADKHLLVEGLKAQGKVVAATGDGINDVQALGRADVGFAMGSGCSAAKEAASLVLTDDDFEAGLRAVMWGRNIYANVSRFLQFQVTVNISVIATVFFGIIILGTSPLSAVQLLWINLIMDTFAAIALATEPPIRSVIEGRKEGGGPVKEDAAVLSTSVWRQILGVAGWNFLVMLVLMLAGCWIADLPSYAYSTPLLTPAAPSGMTDPCANVEEGACLAAAQAALKAVPTTDATDAQKALAAYLQELVASLAKQRHFTYIFNTFVFLQIFNEINCRKVGVRDFNVFEAPLHNPYFLLVVAATVVVQVALCQVCTALAGTVPLRRSEWGACVVVGATPLLVSLLLKLTPIKWVNDLAGALPDEDRAPESKILTAWHGAGPAAAKAAAEDEGAFTQAPE